MEKKYYREHSRTEWYSTDSAGTTIEQINCGSLQRIADAAEKMAKNHSQLISDLDWYKKRFHEQSNEIKRLSRSNAALRGYMRSLKNNL